MNTFSTMQGGISTSAPKRITTVAGSWSSLGTGTNNAVRSISSLDPSNVYVAGYFSQANGSTVNYIARWNGSSWSNVGPAGSNGLNYLAETVTVFDASNIYFGGQFGQALLANGDVVWASYIIRWSGSVWDEFGPGGNDTGVDRNVYSISALSASNIYISGWFTGAGPAGSIPVSRIARWTGSWNALGTGLNGIGFAVAAIDDNNVYAGGEFTAAGGVSNTAYIAKWNGSAWTALGTGVNNVVYAISFLDASNVYVGGDFTTAGGTTRNFIAKWNGSSWSSLGSGTNGSVRSIHAYDASNIIVGGNFTTAGGVTCNRVAKWNGSWWNALGSGTVGVNAGVNAVRMVDASNIYVGGDFTSAGGATRNYIAKFTAT